MGEPITPQKAQRSRREEARALSRYEKQVKALQSPAVRQKISEGVKCWQTKQTAEQRTAHNLKIAVAYRRSTARKPVQLEHVCGPPRR